MVKNYSIIAVHSWLIDFRNLSKKIYRESHPELDLIPISQSKMEFELHKQYARFTKYKEDFDYLYDKHKDKIRGLKYG